jgi:Uma2 family endonuclease
MSTISPDALLTPEEFELLPDSYGVELIDGKLQEKKMGTESGSIIARIMYFLWSVVFPAGLGEVIGGDGMYRCFPSHPKRVRKPDVSFVRRDRLPDGRVPRGIIDIRPDLAVEVISPGDYYYEVDEKIADFFDAAIPLIWIVSPQTRTVMVYRLDGTCQRLRDTDDLTADPVISGFRAKIADFFPNPPESAFEETVGAP